MHLLVMDIQFALFKIQPEIIQAELLSPSGNHDDGHIGLLPDLPQHLHAVDVRQSQIQQNQVRMIHAKKGYAGQPPRTITSPCGYLWPIYGERLRITRPIPGSYSQRWAWGTGLWMNRDPKDTKFQTRSKVYRKAGVVRRQAARYFLEYLFRKQNCLEKNR